VFNNGMGRPGGNHSSVDEIVPPADAQGRYERKPGVAFGPEQPVWSYAAPDKANFYCILVSGAQRLANGNTLICSGANGVIFEVNAEKELVWQYKNPAASQSRPMLGDEVGPGGSDEDEDPAVSNLVLSSSVQVALKLTSPQKEQLRTLQKRVSAKLDGILTREQREQVDANLDDASDLDARRGQVISPAAQKSLKLTSEQKGQLVRVQREVDTMIDQMLATEQKQQLTQMRASSNSGARGIGPAAAGLRALGQSSLFRAYRYAPDYPGLADKGLILEKSTEHPRHD
jgi:hypothetical protein